MGLVTHPYVLGLRKMKSPTLYSWLPQGYLKGLLCFRYFSLNGNNCWIQQKQYYLACDTWNWYTCSTSILLPITGITITCSINILLPVTGIFVQSTYYYLMLTRGSVGCMRTLHFGHKRLTAMWRTRQLLQTT